MFAAHVTEVLLPLSALLKQGNKRAARTPVNLMRASPYKDFERSGSSSCHFLTIYLPLPRGLHIPNRPRSTTMDRRFNNLVTALSTKDEEIKGQKEKIGKLLDALSICELYRCFSTKYTCTESKFSCYPKRRLKYDKAIPLPRAANGVEVGCLRTVSRQRDSIPHAAPEIRSPIRWHRSIREARMVAALHKSANPCRSSQCLSPEESFRPQLRRGRGNESLLLHDYLLAESTTSQPSCVNSV